MLKRLRIKWKYRLTDNSPPWVLFDKTTTRFDSNSKKILKKLNGLIEEEYQKSEFQAATEFYNTMYFYKETYQEYIELNFFDDENSLKLWLKIQNKTNAS